MQSTTNWFTQNVRGYKIMRIQYTSDIHLELLDNSRFINSMPFEVTGDVLVFAGDIGYLRDKTLPNMKF